MLLFTASSAFGAQTLYEYYTEQGVPLPSVEERVPTAESCGIDNYQGTLEQNEALLACQQDGFLGASLPQQYALIDTYLASSITDSDTSMTLASGTTKDGASLSGRTCFIIDVNTPTAEFVCGTASGTSVTSLERGIKFSDPTSTSTSLAFSHRRFASVQVTDFPFNQLVQRIFNGTDTIPALMSYDTDLLIVAGSATSTLATKYYVDNVAVAGASDADDVTKGIGELATPSEMAAGTVTGGTGANLILWSKYATSTSQVAQNSIPITDTDGKLDQSFYDLTENFTWTGDHTFNGTTTLGTLIGGGVAFAATASTTIAQLDPVYASSTVSGAYYKTQATTTVGTTAPVFDGFALTGGSNGDTIYIQTEGVVSGFSGLTPGSKYYVDEDGNLSTSAQSYAEVYVGKAVSATEILIEKGKEQYVGNESLSNTGSTGATAQDTSTMHWWATKAVANVKTIDGAARKHGIQGDVTIERVGKTSGVVWNSDDSGAAEFQTSVTCSLSGDTITCTTGSTAGSATTLSGTVYYYR